MTATGESSILASLAFDLVVGRVPIVVEKEKGVFSRYPKKQLAHGVSQTEEEYAYGRRYTKIGS